MAKKSTNWEKIGVYLAAIVGFLTIVMYIGDLKERVSKLEVRVENLMEKR